MNRTLITRGMQHLGFANMVFRRKAGIYQLNPMISGFRTYEQQRDAIAAMAPEDRFDFPDCEERYLLRVAEHEAAKKSRTRRSQVADLTERRLRSIQS